MKLHRNAALSWNGRRQLVERVAVDGWTVAAAAAAAGVSVRCARKWVGRYRAAGEAGLLDRSSAPKRVANRTAPERVAVIVALRQLRMTAAEIAETLAMPLSTVSGVLKRNGLGRLGRIGLEQPVRYERSRPGELVHIDIKKLGRIEGGAGKRVGGAHAGSYRPRRRDAPAATAARSAGSSSMSPSTTTAASPTPKCSPTRKPPPQSASCVAPSPSTAATASHVEPSSPTTAPPTSQPSTRSAAAQLGIRHLRTRPRRPQTNGKAERFIRTMLNGWAYGAIYRSSPNGPQPLTAGSGTTTIDDDTQHSATNPRSAEPTCSGPTSSRGLVWRRPREQPSDRARREGVAEQPPLDERGTTQVLAPTSVSSTILSTTILLEQTFDVGDELREALPGYVRPRSTPPRRTTALRTAAGSGPSPQSLAGLSSSTISSTVLPPPAWHSRTRRGIFPHDSASSASSAGHSRAFRIELQQIERPVEPVEQLGE